MRQLFIFSIIILGSFNYSSSVFAQHGFEMTEAEHECYALSMIGYDHVINSRVGLPIEDAVNAMTVNEESPAVRSLYKNHILDVVYMAYAWQGSPHDYAVRTMFRCARQSVHLEANLSSQ